MPTVIDTLIIELGLDPAKLTAGQKEAISGMKKTTDEAKKAAKDAEDISRRTTQWLGRMGAQVLAFSAAAFGAHSISEFVQRVTQLGAESGRTAKALDTSVPVLAKWRGLAELTGGTAAGMTGSIKSLVQGFQQFALTGNSQVIPYLRALGIQITDGNNKFKGMELFLEMADKFSKMDPARAHAFGAAMGIDGETVNLLIRGRTELEKLLKKMEELGPMTKFEADQSQRLYESWQNLSIAAGNLGRSITSALTPGLAGAFDWIANILGRANKGASKVVDMQRQQSEMTANPSGSGGGAFKSYAEKEAYIRAAAIRNGVDPDQAVRVAKSEGFYGFQSNIINKQGKREESWGAFQLYTGGGLGNVFQKQTGLDPRDPKNEPATIDFAMQQASRGGWGPWHGWKGDKWAGINRVPSGAAAAASTDSSRVDNSSRSSEVHIGKIEVVSQATDADGVARDIKPALERNTFAQQANSGPN